MGVYIKGMEMPQDKAVAVVIHPDGTAYTAEMFAGVFTKYLADCTAVPVPPHGDLIDRDKLEKDIDKYVGGEESRSRFHHWVQVQHTVIPKSEEAQT